MPMIELIDVNKYFDTLHVLNKLNLTIEQGEFVSIIGPSGSGKSTLFKLMTKLDHEYTGKIVIKGKDLKSTESEVAYMPQKDLLLPWKKVIDNITLPLTIKGKKISEDELNDLVALFGLAGFETAYPHQLSGGMRQRAALLRTMLMEREILLLDEPFGAIDSINRLKLQKWLLMVFENFNKTVLFITHDIDEAILLSNKVYVLSDRPASVIEEVVIEFTEHRNETLLTSTKFNQYKQHILSLLNM